MISTREHVLLVADWTVDPHAVLAEAARRSDGHATTASVGDPDPVTAIGDAVQDRPADEVLLFARSPRFFSLGPLDLRHRAQRMIGRPVRHVSTPRSRSITIAMPCPTPMHIVARP